MSGLGLWLDTKNLDGKINTTINNGDSLSKWVDLSRNQYHPTGPDSNRLPTYQDNGLDFSGDYLSFTDDLTFLRNNSFTIIVVEQRHTSVQNYIFGPRTWGTNVGLHFGYRNENNFSIAFYSNDTNHTVSSLKSSQANIVSGVYDKSISDYTQRRHIYYNGEKILSNSSSFPRSEDLQRTDNIDLGRLWGGSGNYFDGVLREILMFDRPLSGAEVVQINYYLANKWNLSDTVDSDGDGHVDSFEILKGTSPTDPNSKPAPTVVSKTVQGRTPGGVASLSFDIPSGTTTVKMTLKMAGDFNYYSETTQISFNGHNLGSTNTGYQDNVLRTPSGWSNRSINNSYWSAGSTSTITLDATPEVNYDAGWWGFYYKYEITLEFQ